MDSRAVKETKEAIIKRFGNWTDSNIHIVGDVYTVDERVVSEKLRRILQVVADVAAGPLANLRILDLACQEGQYAIEFARHGAHVVGIEGREVHLEKARFVKDALRLDNLGLFQDDVRNLSKEKYGLFDAVLCLGIFYHVDGPDLFRFAESISEVSTQFAIFDTHVWIGKKEPFTHKDKCYWGARVREHEDGVTSEERLKNLWGSLDNKYALWLSRDSLYNLLLDVGFTSIYECNVPVELKKPSDRVTLLAIKGIRQSVINQPRGDEMLMTGWPEGHKLPPSQTQQKWYQFRKRLTHMIPKRLRQSMKRALVSAGLMAEDKMPWEKGIYR